MLDIKIGPTSFRPSCQLACAHSQQGSLTVPWLWAEQYSHVIFLRSFIRNYLYLVMSQYSYACLIERSNLQNKENAVTIQ